jgi:signal peptidase complex subunit 3
VTATWPDTVTNKTNTAVIWDQIITAPSSDHLSNFGPATKKKLIKSAAGKPIDPSRGLLKLKNQKAKYQITHPSGKIAGTKDVKLQVHYNVQPWVGLLTWDQGRDIGKWKAFKGGISESFMLPELKVKA